MTVAARAELISLLRAVSFRRGHFTLASGRESSYYVDARPTTMSARGLALIGTLGLQEIRAAGWEANLVGGLTLGADPVAYAIALASDLDPPRIDGFTVRKESKGHGTGRLIEGPFRAGARVVIVEDVITTGGSAHRAAEAVEAGGGLVVGILAVVDRQEGGAQYLQDAGFPVRALIKLADLTD